MWKPTSGVDLCVVNKTILRRSSNLEIMFYGLPKEKNIYLGKFKKRWFGPFRVQYCLPNNIVIFFSINNFEPNLVLVNVNKLKPYTYVD
jgi:hypothetical protein